MSVCQLWGRACVWTLVDFSFTLKVEVFPSGRCLSTLSLAFYGKILSI